MEEGGAEEASGGGGGNTSGRGDLGGLDRGGAAEEAQLVMHGELEEDLGAEAKGVHTVSAKEALHVAHALWNGQDAGVRSVCGDGKCVRYAAAIGCSVWVVRGLPTTRLLRWGIGLNSDLRQSSAQWGKA